MPQQSPYLNRTNLTWLTCAILIVALLTSKFVLTLGMAALVALGLIRKDLKTVWQNFISNNTLLALTAIFFIILISGLYSQNTAYLLERLRIKLPFLLLPIALIGLPKFTDRQYFSLLYILILLIVISCIGVGINYVLNFEEINYNIGRSGSIPTPINHIRFSLLVALSFFASIYTYYKNFYLKFAWEKYLLLGCALFLLVFIHILSVRSGILALYLAGFTLIVRYILLTKRYLVGSIMALAIIALPILAFQFSSGFRAQAYLMRHNYIEFFIKKNVGEYSDTQRLASYQMAFVAAKSTPLTGVGAGDIKDATQAAYATHYPTLDPKLPHNQFLFFYTATGLIGLLLFVIAFFIPLFHKKRYLDTLFLAFYTIVFTSFMVENTLETAIGTAFFMVFLIIMLNRREAFEVSNN